MCYNGKNNSGSDTVKKIFSVLLALTIALTCLCLPLSGVTASAKGFETENGVQVEIHLILQGLT